MKLVKSIEKCNNNGNSIDNITKTIFIFKLNIHKTKIDKNQTFEMSFDELFLTNAK